MSKRILLYNENGIDGNRNLGELQTAFGKDLTVDVVRDLNALEAAGPKNYDAVLVAGNSTAIRRGDLEFALEYVHEERGKGHDKRVFVAGPENGIDTPHVTQRYLAPTGVLSRSQASNLVERAFGK